MAAPGGRTGAVQARVELAVLGAVVVPARRARPVETEPSPAVVAPLAAVTPLPLSPPVDNAGENSGNTGDWAIPDREVHLRWRPPDGRRPPGPAGKPGAVELGPEGQGVSDAEPASLRAVASTFALCRAADVEATLALVVRSLAPGGTFHFLEHAATPGWARRLQQLGTPLWQRLAAGCHLDRDAPAAIRAAGLVITDIERFPLAWGRALGVRGVRGTARLRPEGIPSR